MVLDQWDITLGGDMPSFMEKVGREDQRVLAICTKTYSEKADAGQGGVGYEKMILTADLMENINSDRIVPIIRDNKTATRPVFLKSKLYIDFRDESDFESKYTELLHSVHEHPIKPRPPLGQNPFTTVVPSLVPAISFSPERYVNAATAGKVTFDYSNNNGKFIVGVGDTAFETAWSKAGGSAIYAYSDPPSIRSVALADGVVEIARLADATQHDTSSRVRNIRIGEIAVWQNTAGYYLATKVTAIKVRDHNSDVDELTFEYRIAPQKSSSFLV